MKKIPTLFVRDPDDRKHVLNEVTPGCDWVLAGEGVATRKYDGTCVMFDGEDWWARREVKPGKGAGGARPATPPNFVALDHDPITSKTVGWEPAEQSGFAKFIKEAIRGDEEPGTYELIGPKVNGNPERVSEHVLIPHGKATIPLAYPLTFEGLRERFTTDWPHEGIVWHHPDGHMVKLKVRDFT